METIKEMAINLTYFKWLTCVNFSNTGQCLSGYFISTAVAVDTYPPRMPPRPREDALVVTTFCSGARERGKYVLIHNCEHQWLNAYLFLLYVLLKKWYDAFNTMLKYIFVTFQIRLPVWSSG